jgi:hypothetical protein
MKTKSSRLDRLVARYYPAVYSFATRLTDDPAKRSRSRARRSGPLGLPNQVRIVDS